MVYTWVYANYLGTLLYYTLYCEGLSIYRENEAGRIRIDIHLRDK